MNGDEMKAALEGGYISSVNLDMLQNSLQLMVEVLDHGGLSRYSLQFASMSTFSFETVSKVGGERLQLTEMWIQETPSGSSTEEWSVLVSIFDTTHLRIKCTRIALDGVTINSY